MVLSVKAVQILLSCFLFFLSSVFGLTHQILIIRGYKHQYFLILLYFLGETMSIFLVILTQNTQRVSIEFATSILAIDDSCNNVTNTDTATQTKSHWFLGIKRSAFWLPCSLDIIEKILVFNGILFLEHNTIFIGWFMASSTFILSTWLFRNRWNEDNIIGSGLIIVGFGMWFFRIQKETEYRIINGNIYSIGAILIGCWCKIMQYWTQFYYISSSNIESYREVGYEGVYGSIVLLFVILLLHFIPCDSLNHEFIIKNCNNDNKHFENILTIFSDIYGFELILLLLFFISTVFYSLSGVLIWKRISIWHRVFLENGIVIFYLVILSLFQLKELEMTFSWYYVIGFLLTWTGFIYLIKSLNNTTSCDWRENEENNWSGRDI